jgi:hypothetical protein
MLNRTYTWGLSRFNLFEQQYVFMTEKTKCEIIILVVLREKIYFEF